ncbi:NADPH:quinone oxidoreductase family protein [Aliiroseovarius crassostreae]|uniref:NADPH:quinone oxidoreductase family protein n=1 Tax=Aliiroseovarius crassostreae TaxID=154981 RepID=UPI00220FB5E7|nr:NADPH:quinone oxidoreductase family protein [Aliiroseovarius crassostreae]UWQ05268.1 NADPH:quinone oxidoreductase family protein [Aliiroseovarius crassostreae]
MRAVQITDHSGHPQLIEAQPLSAPADGQVQVEIRACGLNFADLLMSRGKYQEKPDLPTILGMEPAGVITKVGPGVSDLKTGDRVAVFSGHGGLAEVGNFDAGRCAPLSEGMSFTDAAAFQIAYGTSHLALDHKARLQPGETLLVLGAAGGVGLTAVEIGKLMGATVIACARGADKLDICKKAGADHVIDSDSADIRDVVKSLGGADVVYDAVGGEQGEAAFRAMNPDGRFLFIGFASGDIPNLKPNHMLVKNITAIGLYWGGYLKFAPEVVVDSLKQLFQWHAEGKLTPHVGQTFPLEQALDALELLRARKSTGKVVVTMGEA